MLLKELRTSKNYSQQKVADLLNVSRSTVAMWETNKSEPDNETLLKLAEIFDTSLDYLMGRTDEKNAIIIGENKILHQPNTTEDYITFPVIGEIAAGYDQIATEDWEGDIVDVPASYLKGRSREEFFVLRIRGDSMYPHYQEGDKVLILKQTTLNASGDVGAIIYDDDIGTLKKVEYVQGEDWLKLVPINPNYPPILIEGERLEHCKVIGIPKLLIREI